MVSLSIVGSVPLGPFGWHSVGYFAGDVGGRTFRGSGCGRYQGRIDENDSDKHKRGYDENHHDVSMRRLSERPTVPYGPFSLRMKDMHGNGSVPGFTAQWRTPTPIEIDERSEWKYMLLTGCAFG